MGLFRTTHYEEMEFVLDEDDAEIAHLKHAIHFHVCLKSILERSAPCGVVECQILSNPKRLWLLYYPDEVNPQQIAQWLKAEELL